jgi:hypothetical protein
MRRGGEQGAGGVDGDKQPGALAELLDGDIASLRAVPER